MFFYPGVPVYHSKDLINWNLIGYCLTTKEHFCLDKNNSSPMMYAATLRYHDGTFYMITTEVNGGGNFFVTAKNPAGPWSAPVFIDRPMFDPSLFFDDDGKVYYTRRGSFDNKDIVQAEIDISTGKLLTELRSVGKGLVSDDIEGPHLYKVDGLYYLMRNEGARVRFIWKQSEGVKAPGDLSNRAPIIQFYPSVMPGGIRLNVRVMQIWFSQRMADGGLFI